MKTEMLIQCCECNTMSERTITLEIPALQGWNRTGAIACTIDRARRVFPNLSELELRMFVETKCEKCA